MYFCKTLKCIKSDDLGHCKILSFKFFISNTAPSHRQTYLLCAVVVPFVTELIKV